EWLPGEGAVPRLLGLGAEAVGRWRLALGRGQPKLSGGSSPSSLDSLEAPRTPNVVPRREVKAKYGPIRPIGGACRGRGGRRARQSAAPSMQSAASSGHFKRATVDQ